MDFKTDEWAGSKEIFLRQEVDIRVTSSADCSFPARTTMDGTRAMQCLAMHGKMKGDDFSLRPPAYVAVQ